MHYFSFFETTTVIKENAIIFLKTTISQTELPNGHAMALESLIARFFLGFFYIKPHY